MTGMSPFTSGFNYVYILQAEREPQRLSIGVTANLAFGVAQHNAGAVLATARHRPWNLRLALAFRDCARAEKFEQYLKTSSGRAFAQRHF